MAHGGHRGGLDGDAHAASRSHAVQAERKPELRARVVRTQPQRFTFEGRVAAPSALLSAQRRAGNRAVTQLVQRSTSPQRDLNDEQKKSWAELGGPKLIEALKSATEEWKKFRASPDSYGSLPKTARAPSQLAELLRTGDYSMPATPRTSWAATGCGT